MNIIDAVKSGKRHKRKAYREWYLPVSPTSTCYSSPQYSDADILADDWEVEETRVTITEAEFNIKAAWILAGWECNETDDAYGAVRCALKDLKKELGL